MTLEEKVEWVSSGVIATDNGITRVTVSRYRQKGIIPERCYRVLPSGDYRFQRKETNESIDRSSKVKVARVAASELGDDWRPSSHLRKPPQV